MAATARARNNHPSVLGELPLSNIQNTTNHRVSSIEALTRQLDSLHIHASEKENKSKHHVHFSSTTPAANDATCDSFYASSGPRTNTVSRSSEDSGDGNPLALADNHQLPSTQEQLSKLQEGQFEWLLSIPVKTSAHGRRPRGDSHGDAELRPGDKMLHFGCNLVHRRSLSSDMPAEGGESTDVYTLLATRIDAAEELEMELAGEGMQTAATEAGQLGQGSREGGLDVSKSPQLSVGSREHSRPVSRIEDSVEALDKLEEEIEALAEVAHLDRVLSPEASNARKRNSTGAKATAPKRAASVRAGTSSARAKPMERSSSVRKAASTTPAKEGEKTTASGSGSRKLPRPTSLLPPKPPARSNKAPTVPVFELPGEAVARRLKEQREQRRSQQISSEDAAALAATYSPAKPHFKSAKPPTVPTFELPGEAVARRLKEQREQRRSQQISAEDLPHSPPKPPVKSPRPPTTTTRPAPEHPSEAKLRAREEEERKRREFKARPYRGSAAPSTVPRETLASLARQKLRHTEGGSSDSVATTVSSAPAPAAGRKRHSVAAAPTPPAAATSASPRPPATANTNNNIAGGGGVSPRGRHDNNTTTTTNNNNHPSSSRATSASTGSVRSSHSGKHHPHPHSSPHTKASGPVSPAEAHQQKQRGREVFARDNAYTAEREREKRGREQAARAARQEAAERSRMLSREWKERREKKRGEQRGKVVAAAGEKGQGQEGQEEQGVGMGQELGQEREGEGDGVGAGDHGGEKAEGGQQLVAEVA